MEVKQIIENITPDIRKEMESIWFTADLHQGHPLNYFSGYIE